MSKSCISTSTYQNQQFYDHKHEYIRTKVDYQTHCYKCRIIKGSYVGIVACKHCNRKMCITCFCQNTLSDITSIDIQNSQTDSNLVCNGCLFRFESGQTKNFGIVQSKGNMCICERCIKNVYNNENAKYHEQGTQIDYFDITKFRTEVIDVVKNMLNQNKEFYNKQILIEHKDLNKKLEKKSRELSDQLNREHRNFKNKLIVQLDDLKQQTFATIQHYQEQTSKCFQMSGNDINIIVQQQQEQKKQLDQMFNGEIQIIHNKIQDVKTTIKLNCKENETRMNNKFVELDTQLSDLLDKQKQTQKKKRKLF